MVSALDVMTPREHRAQRLSILDAQMKMDAAKRQAAQQQQVEQFFRAYGPGIVRGEQGALEQLGSLGSEGVKAALEVKGQQGLAESRTAATRASEASTRLEEFKLGEAQRQKAVEQITELDTALTAVEAADPSVRGLLYKQQRAEFAKRGYDVSSSPEDYDPNWVKQTRESLVPVKDRIDAYYKSPEYLRQAEEAKRETPAQEEESAYATKRGQLRAESEFPQAARPGSSVPYQNVGPVFSAEGESLGDGRFNRGTGELEVKGAGGQWQAAPTGARQMGINTGGFLPPQARLKLANDVLTDRQGLEQVQSYAKAVGGLNQGIKRWADLVSARIKTLVASGELTPEQFNLLTADAKIQRLIGATRVETVGGGVVTEYDAERIIKAAGGNPLSVLQNPQVTEGILRDLYAFKLQRYQLNKAELDRHRAVYPELPTGGEPSSTIEGRPPAGPVGELPTPSTPEEARRLAPGTRFRAPDGSIRVR